MESRFAFTKGRLLAVEPQDKRATYHDTRTPGLILIVQPTGSRSFFVQRKLAGRAERILIGSFPNVTVEQARKKAAEIHAAIAKDHNPAAVRRALRAEPTFGELVEDYINQKRNRAGKPLADATKEDYRSLVTLHLGSLAKLKLSQITPDTVRKLKIESDSQSNRCRALIGACFNWALAEEISNVPNPARAIKSRLIKSRERFLLPAEFPKFMEAVERSPLSDFFKLALFTGARRSNLQAMAWAEIDFDEETWKIPKSKNGDPITIALPPEAMEILIRRKGEATLNAQSVFPSTRSKSGHIEDPKKEWAEVLEQSGLKGLRLHDLRRTLGSWQARQGASLLVIGKSLGHRSTQATAIYSRLDLDPVRESVQQATAAMMEASRSNVVPPRKGINR